MIYFLYHKFSTFKIKNILIHLIFVCDHQTIQQSLITIVFFYSHNSQIFIKCLKISTSPGIEFHTNSNLEWMLTCEVEYKDIGNTGIGEMGHVFAEQGCSLELRSPAGTQMPEGHKDLL